MDLSDIYKCLKEQSKFLVLTSNSTAFTENLLNLFEEIFAARFPGDVLHIQSSSDWKIMNDFKRLARTAGFPHPENMDLYYIFDIIKYFYFTGGLFVFHEATPKSKIILTMSQYVSLSRDVKFMVGSDSSEWDPTYFRVLWVDRWEFKEEFPSRKNLKQNSSSFNETEYLKKIWTDRSILSHSNVENYLSHFISGFKRRTLRRRGNIRYNVILP